MKNVLRFIAFTLTCTAGFAAHADAVCAGYAEREAQCRPATDAGDFTRWDTFANQSRTDGYFVHRIVNGREDKHVVFVITDADLKKGDRIQYVVVEHGFTESLERHDSDTRRANAAASGK